MMKSKWPARLPGEGATSAGGGGSFKEKLLAIIASDPFTNTIVVAAVMVGFFHGWLKINFPHPGTTFLFDALLLSALGIVFFRQKSRERFLPAGKVGAALQAFYVVCAIYAILPFGPPKLVAIAALRGWCFATLAYALGFHLTKSLPQVRGYFYVLVILGVLTSAYGLRQSPEEIERRMMEDEEFAQRYRYTYYAAQGERQLRIFSTFVSSGAFGGTLAYVITFTVILITAPEVSRKDQVILGMASIPMCYAMILTGARSAILMVGVGLLLIAWYRRRFQTFFLVPAVICGGFTLAIKASQGAIVERMETLLEWEAIFYRAFVPTLIGIDFLKDTPWGGGLGKTTHGVPMFLLGRDHYRDYVYADGDLGKIMIEMGVVGLIVFGNVLWRAGQTAFESLRVLRETPVSSVALASSVCIVLAVITFPVGSPLLGIPMGPLTWFFLGTLQKLSEEYQRGTLSAGTEELSPGKPERRFLHFKAKRGSLSRRTGSRR